MSRNTIIITADERQKKLAELLDGDRMELQFDKYENIYDVIAEEYRVDETIVILPIPISKLNKNQDEKEKLKEELIKCSMHIGNTTKVFGGVFSKEWENFFLKHQIPYWDFMQLPEVVEGNAWITAEGTVAEVLKQSAYSIRHQKVMVLGYGCCGEKIAKLFQAMDAEVMIVARRWEVRQKAKEEGFQAIDFEDMDVYIGEMNTVINTVPASVLAKKSIEHMRRDSCIVDIASHPGGTDFEAAKNCGISATLALGLPGLYTTTSSAEILKKAIQSYAPSQDDGKGGKSWIFQIVI